MTSPDLFTPDTLLAELDRLEVSYTRHHHPPMRTVEDSKALRGDLPGGHCKNLFLRNKKGRMWLLVALEDAAIDLKDLGARLDAGRLSFGSPERLMENLGVVPGAVCPFGAINDREGGVQVVLHRQMLDHDPLNYHPLTNDQTIALNPADLVRFLEAIDHPPAFIDL